ncbi:IS3 family transposase [Myroides odoratimimus]|uniref:IS3 family transposase n=1 Tax=Myroides odoratimimus TaxID=76832 RepID=UPI001A9EED62|nr:IS3 family transposase [Myroides odoratimimus]
MERVKYLLEQYKLSIVRICSLVGLCRSMWYYQSKKDDTEVIDKLSELAEQYPTRGFDEYYHKIRREGLIWNRKRVLRVYRLMKLSLRRKHKKRLITRVKQPLETPKVLNECWSMDFMSDLLTDGRKVRVFNVLDDCNREAIAIEAGLSYPARAVIETLENLKHEIGTPKYIRCDNGPEFISKTFVKWCEMNFIEIKYTQPGKPMQNGYIERFNRFFREDILDAFYFNDIYQLQRLADKWREDYNFNHPHKALGNKSPKEYKPRFDEEFKFFIKSEHNKNYLSNLEVS